MKKALAVFLCFPLLNACAQQTTVDTVQSIVIDSDDSRSDAEIAAQFLSEILPDRPDSPFAKKAAESGTITVCTLTDVPEGWELKELEVSSYSDYLTMHYRNADSQREISFIWGFGTENFNAETMSKCFQSAPLPGYEGYYYIESEDDTGAAIRQIFWADDGMQMQVNVPAGLIQGAAPMPVHTEKASFSYPMQ